MGACSCTWLWGHLHFRFSRRCDWESALRWSYGSIKSWSSTGTFLNSHMSRVCVSACMWYWSHGDYDKSWLLTCCSSFHWLVSVVFHIVNSSYIGPELSTLFINTALASGWYLGLILQSLVPLGSVEELLAAYDSQRRELPPLVTVWEWGWTKSAETWNGRAAMLAVVVLLVLEVTTGEGFLHQWGILPLHPWI